MLYKRISNVVTSILILILIIVAMTWLVYAPDGKLLRERITGETPQAKLEVYVHAIAHGDQVTALDQWELPHLSNQEQLNALVERRRQVTSDLLAAGLSPKFTILHIQWWGTCCEPGVLKESRDAGGARMHVQLLDKKGLPLVYVFDIFVRNLPYWGAAEGYPVRHWVIRDVYPEGQEPLYWRFVAVTNIEFLKWQLTPTS